MVLTRWIGKNQVGTPQETSGTTNIVVIQPTAMAGYLFLLNEKWVITPTLAFGFEVNVVEDGEEVGEGAIGLWGINLGLSVLIFRLVLDNYGVNCRRL